MSKQWRNGSTHQWRKIRERIIARDVVCQLCGQDQGQMHIDHITAKSKGGTDMDSNLRLLCQSCNLRKGAGFFERAPTPPTLQGLYIPKNVSISHD